MEIGFNRRRKGGQDAYRDGKALGEFNRAVALSNV